ncbi:HesB/IscA family protein [Marinibactrum halimedae]|uniref:Iron-binding protein IscA n=1 Tax=Marinibactrum halimedae TaxID=1444977 RepID=A0AA37T7Y7_9GAMM|nr:iron-sulfur cluster assembly accessory protein [Marinibactrum halimedae]MCD9457732.1 iron-sulfur cluster assembly accessory protein [Marinibactrum halimedae]GLS24895.1 iron-binding protein IscA [Marinibactrum halimedae]
MSVATYDPSATPVTVTDKALKYFEKNKTSGVQSVIRLSTETRGCTGYAYVLDFVPAPEEGDALLTLSDGLSMAIDQDTLALVRGTEIDLVTEGINQVVKFNNPNVVSECGCGESFSVS